MFLYLDIFKIVQLVNTFFDLNKSKTNVAPCRIHVPTCVEGIHLQIMHLESDEPFSLLHPPPSFKKKRFQGFQSTEHFQTDGFVIYDETGENPFHDV